MGYMLNIDESKLRQLITKSVKMALNEGIFDFFRKRKESPREEEPNKQQFPQDNDIFSGRDMQYLYDNQNSLTPIEREVLNVGMWERAMRAGYHGYAKDWPNIMIKDGEVYYFDQQSRKWTHRP